MFEIIATFHSVDRPWTEVRRNVMSVYTYRRMVRHGGWTFTDVALVWDGKGWGR